MRDVRVGATCGDDPVTQRSDLVMMTAPDYSPGRARIAKDAGKWVWAYNGQRPYAGALMLDVPATDLRANAWIAARYDVDRWFYWESTYWFDDNRGGEGGWDGFDPFVVAETFHNAAGDHANGDGILVYPGRQVGRGMKDFGVDDVFASVRLKNLRRGIQDAGYSALARAVDPDATNAIVRRMVPACARRRRARVSRGRSAARRGSKRGASSRKSRFGGCRRVPRLSAARTKAPIRRARRARACARSCGSGADAACGVGTAAMLAFLFAARRRAWLSLDATMKNGLPNARSPAPTSRLLKMAKKRIARNEYGSSSAVATLPEFGAVGRGEEPTFDEAPTRKMRGVSSEKKGAPLEAVSSNNKDSPTLPPPRRGDSAGRPQTMAQVRRPCRAPKSRRRRAPSGSADRRRHGLRIIALRGFARGRAAPTTKSRRARSRPSTRSSPTCPATPAATTDRP